MINLIQKGLFMFRHKRLFYFFGCLYLLYVFMLLHNLKFLGKNNPLRNTL